MYLINKTKWSKSWFLHQKREDFFQTPIVQSFSSKNLSKLFIFTAFMQNNVLKSNHFYFSFHGTMSCDTVCVEYQRRKEMSQNLIKFYLPKSTRWPYWWGALASSLCIFLQLSDLCIGMDRKLANIGDIFLK